MWILKTPHNIVYDTSNPDFKRLVFPDHHFVVPLGLVLDCDVYDYLVGIYKEPSGINANHILYQFSISNYFVTNKLICDIP